MPTGSLLILYPIVDTSLSLSHNSYLLIHSKLILFVNIYCVAECGANKNDIYFY